MTLLTRIAVTWVLLLAMPFHALTVVYLDLMGPAHFHLDDDFDDHASGDWHSHYHDQLERHHHHPGDHTVVTIEDSAVESLAAEESTAGWSGTMCVALVSAHPSLQPQRMPNGIAPGRESRLHTRFLGRLERPPRIDRV